MRSASEHADYVEWDSLITLSPKTASVIDRSMAPRLLRTMAYRNYTESGQGTTHEAIEAALDEVQGALCRDRQRQCDCRVCQRQKRKRSEEIEAGRHNKRLKLDERLHIGGSDAKACDWQGWRV